MAPIDRRSFLSSSAIGAALALARPGRALGANDKVVLALIGAGGRGRGLAIHPARPRHADAHRGRALAACATGHGRWPRHPRETQQDTPRPRRPGTAHVTHLR